MKFFSKLFSKNSEDIMAKGDRLFEAERFFEARNLYEEGLELHLNRRKDADTHDDIAEALLARIKQANRSMAEVNIHEAEFALSRGNNVKAEEHLELAKSLTDDSLLREKTEKLLANLIKNTNDTNKLASSGGACNSCASIEPEMQVVAPCEEPDLSPLDYYDLLIRQLPGEMYSRYARLGEKFAYMYLAASRDEHQKALDLLEGWCDGSCRDIYLYEKGMILHRLGNTREAEDCLIGSVDVNTGNPLPHLGLALLLIDDERFDEAAARLDTMIADGILPEQSLMLRGNVCHLAGDADGAIKCYGMLLSTSYARPAAENLHAILMQCDRQDEAAVVFKRYLGGCKKH